MLMVSKLEKLVAILLVSKLLNKKKKKLNDKEIPEKNLSLSGKKKVKMN
jgi:hypothetical protein